MAKKILFLASIFIISIACQTVTGTEEVDESVDEVVETGALPSDTPIVEGGTPQPSPEPTSEFESDFPVTDDAHDIREEDGGQLNYQTSKNLDEVVEFYRQSFTDLTSC